MKAQIIPFSRVSQQLIKKEERCVGNSDTKSFEKYNTSLMEFQDQIYDFFFGVALLAFA